MTKDTSHITACTGLGYDGNDSIVVKVDTLTLKQRLEIQSIIYSQQQRRSWCQKCQQILSGGFFCTSLSIASFLFPPVCKPASAAPSPSSYASMASRTPPLSSGGAQTTLYEHHVPSLQPTYLTRGLTPDRLNSAKAFGHGPSSGLRRRKSKSSVTGTRYGDGLRSRGIDQAKRAGPIKLSEFDEHLPIAVNQEQDTAESTAVEAEDLPTHREGYWNPYWPETVEYQYYKTYSTNPMRFKSSYSPLQEGNSEFEPVRDPTELVDPSLVEEPVEKVHLNSAERTNVGATKSQSGLSSLAQNGCKHLTQGTSLKISAEGKIGLPWVGETKAAIESETLSMVQQEFMQKQANDLAASVIERKANSSKLDAERRDFEASVEERKVSTSKTKTEEKKILLDMELAKAEDTRKQESHNAEETRKQESHNAEETRKQELHEAAIAAAKAEEDHRARMRDLEYEKAKGGRED